MTAKGNERERERKRAGLLKAKRESLQHQHFPRGPPPQYYAGRTKLNFTVRMGRGAFFVVWP